MAEQLPINFQLPSETASATYSFSDIQNGTGTVVYDAFISEITGLAYDYHLSTGVSDAGTQSITRTTSGTTVLQFDVKFNLPQTLKGDCFFFWTCYAAGSNVTEARADIRIDRLATDGVTVTALSSLIQGRTFNPAAEAAQRSSTYIDMGTGYNFKVGESLRITVNFVVETSSGTAASFMADPSNSASFAGDTTDTTFKCYIPFKLNL